MAYMPGRNSAASLWFAAAIALSLMLSSALGALCAPAQAPNLSEMSIEDLMNVTVVTAGKKPQTIAKTAAAVFVITREDIERYGYQTLAQALRRISGFYSETDRYIDFIGVRGYLPNSDLNRRVLVLVNGHKVNDYLYGQAPVDQDLPVDMRDIERIEVVKGPGSALWGSEALLCVINCITKTASQMEGFQLGQDLGFRDGQHLSYGHASRGGLEVTASATDEKSNGQQNIYFPEYNTPDDHHGVAVGLDGERVGRGYVDATYGGLKFFYDHVSRTKDVPTAYWWTAFNSPGTDVTDERHYWELSYENPTPAAGDGKIFCRVYNDIYDGICNWGNGPGNINTRNVDQATAWGAEARYSRNISSRLSATLGVEYLQARAERIYVDVDPYLLHNRSIRHSVLTSYYVQTDWDITGSLRLVAGTRLDDHEIFGSNWSPRVGLIYKASPRTTLKVLYGEAFREPSMSETGGDSNRNHLYAEKIKTGELVWEQDLGDGKRLVTSLYGLDMYDVMQMTPSWDTILGSVISRGIETQYDFRVGNGGSGYFGVALMRARSGEPGFTLTSSPNYVVGCGLSVPVFGNKAYLSPDVQCVGSRKTLSDNPVGAVAIANLALTSHSLIKNANVSLGVLNLFNTPSFAPSQLWNVEINNIFTDEIPQGDRIVQFQVSYNM